MSKCDELLSQLPFYLRIFNCDFHVSDTPKDNHNFIDSLIKLREVGNSRLVS